MVCKLAKHSSELSQPIAPLQIYKLSAKADRYDRWTEKPASYLWPKCV